MRSDGFMKSKTGALRNEITISAGIQRVQPGLESRVIASAWPRMSFWSVVAFADVFVQFIIGCAKVDLRLVQLGLVIVHLLFGFCQLFAETSAAFERLYAAASSYSYFSLS